MWFAFTPEMARIEGSGEYFVEELRTLGPMSAQEWWGLGLFSTATLLAFTREFYARALPGMTPAVVFLTLAIVSFMVRRKKAPLL